jgi:hypothetical protein
MRRHGTFAAAILVAAFLAPRVFAKPTISWSTGTISISMLQGTLKTLSVSFVAADDLHNVNIFIVPELDSYITPLAAHFADIVSGTNYEIVLRISVPESTLAGMYNGVLQLRSGTSPPTVFARPLPIALTVEESSSNFIPAEIAFPSLDRVIAETASGPFYAANEVLVAVAPETTEEQIRNLAVAEGATFLGQEVFSRTYQLHLPFSGLREVVEIVERLENYDLVLYAIPAFFSELQSTFPTDPSWNPGVRFDRSWAQEAVHLPSAWDMATGDAASGLPLSTAAMILTMRT